MVDVGLQTVERNAVPRTPQRQVGIIDSVAAQARELREWLRSFVQKHKGGPLSVRNARELEPLNALLRQDQSYLQVVIGKEGIRLDAQRRWPSPDSLLIPIAESIARLISDEDFTHIKACEGHLCTLMFADHTRAHGRRWCNMGICGNRAKVSAHRKRQQAAQ